MSRVRLIALLLGAVFIAALTLLRVFDPLPVRAAREIVFDTYQRIQPREYKPVPVRIVDIDEASLRAFGQWPWPRSRLAELVDRLHAAGAATVVFDFIFAERDRLSPSRLINDPILQRNVPEADRARVNRMLPDNDKLFAEAMKRGYVVLGFSATPDGDTKPQIKAGFAFTGDNPVDAPPQFNATTGLVPELADAAAGIGSLNLSPSRSFGVVRRTPLLWSDGSKLYPSLSAEALRVGQGLSTFVVNAYQDSEGGIESVRIGGFEAPTARTGELLLHYTPDVPERYVSAKDIFDDQRLKELAPMLEGNIVLIGTSATGLFDIRMTSLGESVPGVMVHAQAIEQIILGDYLYRADWTQGLELGFLVLASSLLCVATLFTNPRTSLIIGVLMAASIAAGCWWAYETRGVLLDPSYVLFGGLTTWFVTTLFQYLVADREKRVIRSAFTHYVAPSVLRQIEQNVNSVRLGGETREVTVMFTDIRNFTTLSESMAPHEVVSFLNKILGQLSREVVAEGGTIDKYIGDSVMAFWNAPLDQPGHPEMACRAVLRMREAVARSNATNEFGVHGVDGETKIVAVGFGLNTGDAMIGNVGSLERFDYSAIGDTVNVSSRAESASKELAYDIVVSETTARAAESFAFLDAGRLALKGKSARMPFRILLGDERVLNDPKFATFRRDYEALIGPVRTDGEAAWDPAIHARLLEQADAMPGPMRDYLKRLPTRLVDFVLAEEDLLGEEEPGAERFVAVAE